MADLTPDELAILKMFSPDTYAICLDQIAVRGLVNGGLLEWVPPVWGSSPNYAITKAGEEAAMRTRGVA